MLNNKNTTPSQYGNSALKNAIYKIEKDIWKLNNSQITAMKARINHYKNCIMANISFASLYSYLIYYPIKLSVVNNLTKQIIDNDLKKDDIDLKDIKNVLIISVWSNYPSKEKRPLSPNNTMSMVSNLINEIGEDVSYWAYTNEISYKIFKKLKFVKKATFSKNDQNNPFDGECYLVCRKKS